MSDGIDDRDSTGLVVLDIDISTNGCNSSRSIANRDGISDGVCVCIDDGDSISIEVGDIDFISYDNDTAWTYSDDDSFSDSVVG